MGAAHMTNISFIGFGEAGGILAHGLKASRADVTAAYDILIDDPKRAAALKAKAAKDGILAAPSVGSAVAAAGLVISAVTTSQTLAAAQAVARHIAPGTIFLDINSTSPDVKRRAARAIEDAGADFVEAAVMDLVPPHGHKVPMLLAGAKAHDLAEMLGRYGMNVSVIGTEIGTASAVKMVRSVFMKGFTAILLECLVAAKKLNAEDVVLDSLQTTFPQLDWRGVADYYLPRLIKHAKRQSAEMIAVADTLKEIGVDPITATASGARLAWLADKKLDANGQDLPGTYGELLDIIVKADPN